MDLNEIVSDIMQPQVYRIKQHVVDTILEETVDMILNCIVDGDERDAIVKKVIAKYMPENEVKND